MTIKPFTSFFSVKTELSRKSIIVYGCYIVLLLLFHYPLEVFATKILVNPLLSFIATSVLNDVLFLVLATYIILLFISRFKTFVPSSHVFFVEFLLSLAYLYYRLYGAPWTFQSLYIISLLKYADLINLITLSSGILLISSRLSKPTVAITSGFSDDSPLGKDKADELGFEPYVVNLVTEITKTRPATAIAIGINGKWGSGKTSFLDLIKRHLDHEECIIIDFNPWNSHNAQAIIQDFFQTIRKSLQPYHSQLPAIIGKYAAKLLELQKEGLSKIYSDVQSIFIPLESLNSLHRDINESIKKISKKIIVFIDDVDRLDKEEIAEVVRLIRNTANFNNTFFLVAYDRSYVLYALKNLNAYNPQNFLEKIFQLEINLPYFETIKLQQRLYQKLTERFPEKFHDALKKEILGSKYGKPNYFEGWLETLRDVTRLANGLIVNFESIVNEVVFSEFLRLEILRQKFPAVYELLYKKKVDFLTHSESNVKQGYILKKLGNDRVRNTNFSSETYELDHYILSNSEILGVSGDDRQKIMDLVKSLFESSSLDWNFRSHLSVRFPNRFKLYFTYYLMEGILSESKFNESRSGTLSHFYKMIDDSFTNDLSFEFYQRLLQVKLFNSREDFEKVIRAIFYFSRHVVNDIPYGFDDRNLADKMSDHKNSISKKFYAGNTEDYASFARSLFEDAKAPYTFEADFLEHLNKAFSDEFPLSKEERTAILLRYFDSFVNSLTEWDDVIWRLFHSCSYKDWHSTGGNSYSSVTTYPEACKGIIKIAIDKFLDTFLQRIISLYQFTDDHWYISEIVLTIFGDWGAFQSYLALQDESQHPYLIEFKEFFTKLETGDFKNAVKFEFQVIPARKNNE